MIASRRNMLAWIASGAALAATRAGAAPLDRVVANGVLSVAVYRDFEPWSWRADGQLKGIDVEIGGLIAQAMAVRPSYVELIAGDDVAADLRNAVWRGSLVGQAPADVMMHVPVDRKLALENDRTVILAPYYRESFAMACNRDRVDDCELAPAAYKGRPVAAEIDSVPDFYLTSTGGGVLRQTLRHLPNGPAAVAAAAGDGADFVVATRAQIEHGMTLAKDRLIERKGPLPMMFSPGWNIGVAVKDDSRDLGDRIDNIVSQLVASGKIPAIFARYGVVHRPPAEG